MSDDINPIPGRECGECTYCCENLTVDTPELQLLPGVTCPHCAVSKGCTIYETRPPICHDYMCGWRRLPILDDNWRPDKIGVLPTVVTTNIPAGYVSEGIELLLVDRSLALVRSDFFQFIQQAIAARVPIFLFVPGPPGFFPLGRFLNTILEDSILQQDDRRFYEAFYAILADISNGPFTPATLKNPVQLK